MQDSKESVVAKVDSPSDACAERDGASLSLSRKKAHKLRARRIRVGDLKLGRVVARVRHQDLVLEAEVEDVSPYGVALVIPSIMLSSSLILAGDRLPDLVIEHVGGVLYEGSGVIRRVAERGDRIVLGVELPTGGVNLAEMYRQGTRRSFMERLQAMELPLRHDGISADFKAYVADFRAYLEAMRHFLTAEEDALSKEDRLAREEGAHQYLAEAGPHVIHRMNAAGTDLNRLVAHLSDSEHAVHRAFARAHIMPLILCAPFIRRAYEKPLGYAGDYEMMNMLYRDHGEGDSLYARAVNLYATQEGAAQANINRIDYLRSEIADVVATKPGRVRVASIGCGPTREIWELLNDAPELGNRLDVALIDQEERSIAFCERTLGPVGVRTGARMNFIRESIRRLLTTHKLSLALGERELIYSAGLFDYLSQASFGRLLSTLYEALVPGGRLLVGNVARQNPSRWVMEYYLDWFLVHRSPEELVAAAEALEPRPQHIEVQSEPRGINLFLRIVK